MKERTSGRGERYAPLPLQFLPVPIGDAPYKCASPLVQLRAALIETTNSRPKSVFSREPSGESFKQARLSPLPAFGSLSSLADRFLSSHLSDSQVRVHSRRRMNYGDMPNVDPARTLRRIARHDEPEFSNASILNSMEKFVRTVSEMEDTILVPSRLLDLSVGDADDTICMKGKRGCTVKDTLANTDLYRLYNIINQMKIELLWSQEPTVTDDQMPIKSHPVGSPSAELAHHHPAAMTGSRLGHVRCPSTTSMQSVQSTSSIAWTSDSDSENGIEIDSGLEGEECDLASIAAENFKRHLRGLHSSIARMTEAAEYLTLRYQADMDGQV